MNDYIIRGTAANHGIRAFAATTKDMVHTARTVHDTSPVATAALGRMLTAGAMMGYMLKGDKDLITLQIKGDGPLRGIVVTADAESRVKGYVHHPHVELPLNAIGKLDVSGAIGKGNFRIIRDTGLKEPYVGQIELVSGEIAEDLTYYYATSEQVPSVVALGVLIDRDHSVKQSGGFIIQLMPDVEEEYINKLEERISKLDSITNLLEQGKTPEEILEMILGDMGLQILDRTETSFFCNCTRDRVEKALISIGREEIEEMIEEGKDIQLNCHFCSEAYEFSPEDLTKLISTQ